MTASQGTAPAGVSRTPTRPPSAKTRADLGSRDAAKDPTLELEHAWFEAGVPCVIGLDEVGRGAVAGPVAVGAHAVFAGTAEFPEGLRDSKLLSEPRRLALAPRLEAWGAGSVGYATAQEIDQHGITWALAAAARRALLALQASGIDVPSARVLLDGSHDWLSPALRAPLDVRTLVGADRSCASVAAASVRAKVDRDAMMREAHVAHPHYGWDSNKGYGSRAHYAGIEAHGLTDLHRRSWIRPRSALG